MRVRVCASAAAERTEQFQHADGGRRRLDAQLSGQTDQDELAYSARHAEGEQLYRPFSMSRESYSGRSTRQAHNRAQWCL